MAPPPVQLVLSQLLTSDHCAAIVRAADALYDRGQYTSRGATLQTRDVPVRWLVQSNVGL